MTGTEVQAPTLNHTKEPLALCQRFLAPLVICPQCGGFGVTVLVVARNDASPDNAAAAVNVADRPALVEESRSSPSI